MPTPATRAHALSGAGHHGGGITLPPPVIGDALANTVGLAFLILLPAAAGIAVTAVLVRRVFPSSGVLRHTAFAAAAGVVAAGVTVAVAAVALAGAVSFTESLAASVSVLRNTFVVIVGVCAVGGVPWRQVPARQVKVW
ncbi:hypothetical protein [Alloactinosynnema sp. L-07]|uniref:hypothetical protein n=1 Tax=Alloactinosynnema sp. L-07 TaxID=1653480 RepID=UPI00155FF5A5|nr:hypothetical protein [Alloactinosynnema sp. L-07]